MCGYMREFLKVECFLPAPPSPHGRQKPTSNALSPCPNFPAPEPLTSSSVRNDASVTDPFLPCRQVTSRVAIATDSSAARLLHERLLVLAAWRHIFKVAFWMPKDFFGAERIETSTSPPPPQAILHACQPPGDCSPV